MASEISRSVTRATVSGSEGKAQRRGSGRGRPREVDGQPLAPPYTWVIEGIADEKAQETSPVGMTWTSASSPRVDATSSASTYGTLSPAAVLMTTTGLVRVEELSRTAKSRAAVSDRTDPPPTAPSLLHCCPCQKVSPRSDDDGRMEPDG